MSFVLRAAVGTACAVLLAGCAGSRTSGLRNADPAVEYPPLAVFHKTPSKELAARCDAFGARAPLRRCTLKAVDGEILVEHLRASDYFEKVVFANEDPDYQLLITTALMSEESATDISKVALAGATLMMLPMSTEDEVDVEAVLQWRGVPLLRESFVVPYEESLSLFSDAAEDRRAFSVQLAERFLRDARERQLFSPAYLARQLEADDYTAELKAADTVLDYRLVDRVYPNDPLAAAQLMYQRRWFDFDVVTVSVYPIRRIEWTDTAAVLDEELAEQRQLLESARERGDWREIHFAEPERIDVALGGQRVSGLRQTAYGTDDQGTPQIINCWLLTSADKFVRVRNVVPEVYQGAPREALAQAVLAGLSIPQESQFLARVRHNIRTKAMK